MEVFPHLTTILKIYITLPTKSFLSERIFSKLSVIKNQFRSTMLEERLNCLSVVSVENNTKIPLLYEDAITECAAKTCRKKSIIEVSRAVD
jgi:hypothetical protein